MKTKKKFYGSRIILASFFITGGALGIAWNCNSLFVKAISEETGFARSQVAFLTTILAMTSMVMSFFINKVYKSISPLKFMRVTALVLPLAYCTISFCHRLWQFYLVQIIVAVCVFLTSQMPLSLIIGNWYKKGLGTALGVAFMGSGLVGMVFSSLVGQLLPVYGWRVTYRILSVCIAVLIIPFVWFVLKETPESMGLKPMGSDENAESGKIQEEVWGPTAGEVFKTPSFFFVCLGMFFCMLTITAQLQAVSPRLSDLGYSVAFASNVSALGLGCVAVGKIILGKMYDKMTVKAATCLTVMLGAFALIGEIFAKYPIMIVLIVLGEGISSAIGTVGIPVFTKLLYGNRDYNAIYGKIMAIGNAGGMIAPLFLNAVYDKTGSYDIALWICLIVNILTFIIFSSALSKKKDQ